MDLFELLTALLGDKAAPVITGLLLVAYIWAQVRQLVPPEKLAKLPSWVITLLEFIAANKGKATNELINDPKHIKRVKH